MRHSTLIILFFLFSCDSSSSNKNDLIQIEGSDKILAFIYSDNGKEGLLDTNKKVILPAQFDYIEDWQVDNLIRVDSGGERIFGGDVVGYNFKKYGLITTLGQILFRPQFDDLRVSNNSALVKVNTLFGYVDDKGNWIIKPKYKVAYPFYNGAAIVKDNGYFILLNKKGLKLIDIVFDTIYTFKNGVAVAKKGQKWGLINSFGKFILPLDNYEGIGEYNWYFGEFRKDGKSFLIDTSGNIPIEEGFDEVKIIGNEDSVFAVGKQNGASVRIKLK